jgi:uncharacterized NAD(P)/FAD-binding protein YdhS
MTDPEHFFRWLQQHDIVLSEVKVAESTWHDQVGYYKDLTVEQFKEVWQKYSEQYRSTHD